MPNPKFNSRRSVVYSTKGIVSSSQPLANAAGLKILEKGGNAIDAAVAVAAALTVTETASTDLGGDAYAIFYNAKDQKAYGLNGTGRSASKLSVDYIKKNYPQDIVNNYRLSSESIFTANVPGGIAAWYDSVKKWGSGKVSFEEILQPAIELSENGYPISEISAHLVQNSESRLKKVNGDKSQDFLQNELGAFLPNEGLTAPIEGQLVKNKYKAKTLKLIAQHGKDGFYKGEVAESIVKEVQSRGGLLSLEDLANHTSTFVDPISYEFLGKKLWEIPPNGSGIIALLSLGLIKNLDSKGVIELSKLKHNSVEYLHLIIEVLKLSFKDSEEYVSDSDHLLSKFGIDQKETIEQLLSDKYFDQRSKYFKADSVLDNKDLQVGELPNRIFKSDTVYFTVTDSEGNAASFINSVFMNYGSGILVPDRGFFLQNRGANFSLNPNSKNYLEGNKRSYHTIIPGLITTPLDQGKEDLYASYGIMGGYNQPQAHIQVYLNLLLFGLNPQEALDAPRITLQPHPKLGHTDEGHGSHGPVSRHVTEVNVEQGISEEVVEGLRKLGHHVVVVEGYDRKAFGRGQIIRKEPGEGLIWSAGSDQRADGAAVPQL
ncbi:Gamma-glutamyltranspeptidase 1 [Wickerhamomyces ciferrii]|uniref:Gamma-glutamyltranspeptidase 1 n=1 Tax=Wickerhamomyces ciferrii (strain ATCC 14091 / BCRC 22168 / CBS 111 / JCM 3599 / NBRC 0793 / NRRL Y-1031 F-60-10) TaxID=1206466 RepID=K0KYT1_WICCF|nr:Gamma-glutamyltranspeptidase 1 [Wickerhamomyces ciferrii]CCH46238.1 Gamma-glutamyltranspeptidase 1 [Wickerhamomyces ciferrii]